MIKAGLEGRVKAEGDKRKGLKNAERFGHALQE